MTALARGDEQRMLRFIAEAGSFDGEHLFAGPFLTELGKLVHADWIGFGCGPEYDPAATNYRGSERPGDEDVFDHVDWTAVLPLLDGGMPAFDHLDHNFGAVKLSDFWNRRELRHSLVYDLVLEAAGLEDVLVLRLPIATEMFLIFDRERRDFTERDRELLLALAPHLAHIYEAAQTERRLRTALELHETARAAVVLLDPDGRVGFESTAARELLDRYFGKHGSALPSPIASWLSTPDEPLRVGARGRTLVVSRVGDALVLEERRLQPQLTAREREILELVSEGLTNGGIAERLWISPGTVRKHLDNVYAKLGVHTRTAAAAFLRD